MSQRNRGAGHRTDPGDHLMRSLCEGGGGVTEDKATLAAIEDGRVLAVSITEKKYKTRVFAELHCNRLAQLECNGKSRNMVEPNERRRNETLTAKNDRRPY